MFQSLLWKEWREQRWKAAFGSVVLGAFAAIGLKTRIMPDGLVVALAFVLSTLLFPLFICIGLVAAEKEEKTLPVLLRLPAAGWIPLAVKVLVGSLVLLAPIASVVAVYALFGWNREVESWKMLYSAPLCGVISIEILIWFLACGMKRDRQDSAAMVSLGLFLIWFILIEGQGITTNSITLWDLLLAIQPWAYVVYVPFTTTQPGPLPLWLFALVHSGALILMILWMVRRFPTTRSARS